MNDETLYNALHDAFLKSGRDMGDKLMGLSCLCRNWRRVLEKEAFRHRVRNGSL